MIVYLDQKDWIDLAEGFNDVKPDLKDVANLVVEAAASEGIIFPLSIIHFDETLKQQERAKREHLAEYMVRVSKGWAILPAPVILKTELEDACLRTIGASGYDLQKFAVKKGLSQLMGAKPELVSKVPLPDELRKKNLERIESPETLLMVMKDGLSQATIKNMTKGAEEAAQRIEEIRKDMSGKITNEGLRHRATLAQYLISEVNPKVIEFLLSASVDPNWFAEKFLGDEDQIIRFFQLTPTAYNVVELGYHRDELNRREVDPHDLNDFMGLSIALPYCDVVVHERLWHGIVMKTKLDRMRPTRMLRSGRELPPILKS